MPVEEKEEKNYQFLTNQVTSVNFNHTYLFLEAVGLILTAFFVGLFMLLLIVLLENLSSKLN